MLEDLTFLDLLLRLSLAAVLGLAIGWDRERQEKAAGLRTMALVSLGAAGFMLVALTMTGTASTPDKPIEFDPLRVVAGVVGGIGFIGAGAIIQSGGNVRGLTTAASIWCAAGIGVACGAGMYELASVLTGAVFLVLVVVTAMKGQVLPDGEKNDGSPENQDAS